MTFGLWTLAVIALTLRSLMGLWLRTHLRQGARIASPELALLFQDVSGMENRNVRLLVSDAIDSPVTWGIWQPVILVPRQFEILLHEPETRWGLAHEWSHVQRRDMATLWLAMAAQFLCFYQPLYWVLRRRMILCQDNLADAFAVRQAQSAADYAAFLVRLAASRLRPPAVPALGIFEGRSQLFQRIKMLIESGTDVRPSCRRRIAVLSVCGSLAGLLLLTTIQLDAAPDSPAVAAQAEQAPDTAENLNVPAPAQTVEQIVGPAESGVVKGVLLDAATGKPVAGANVMLQSVGLKTATSDDKGAFRIEQVPLDAVSYRLWAYHRNLVTGMIRLDGTPEKDSSAAPRFQPLRLTMNPGREARFVVTEQATGKSLIGAAVRFGFPDRRRVVTGDDGRVLVSGLLSQNYRVTIEADGYARHVNQIDLTVDGPVSSFSAELVPGGEVHGTVVDEEGRPVAQAEISYREPVAGRYAGEPTDEQGKFRHRFLPLNTPVEVFIQSEKFQENRQDVTLTADNRRREVQITLFRRPAAPSVAGIVVDAQGKPVAGAEVANTGNMPQIRRLATTDADGRFQLQQLLRGFAGFEVTVTAKGHAPQLVPVQLTAANEPAEMRIVLEPGHSLRGRLINEAGAPVAGAFVAARHPALNGMRLTSARTDPNGEFAFDSLPADVRFTISDTTYGLSDMTTWPLDQADPVTITLPDPGLLRGQVLDEESRQPVTNFRIRLEFSRLRQPEDARGSYDSKFSNPGVIFRNDDGRFQFQPLIARMPFELIVEADGYDRHVLPRTVAVRVQDATDIIIPLKRVAPHQPSSLTVQFLDFEGKPVPNVELRMIVSTAPPTGKNDNKFNWVLIEGNQLAGQSYVEQSLAGTTNAQGQFTFQNVIPGKSWQLAYWGERVPKSRWLAPAQTRVGDNGKVVIDVPRPATVRGTIDREKFPNAGEIMLDVIGESALHFKAPLTADGTGFELHNLPVGEVQVYVMSVPVRIRTAGGGEGYRSSALGNIKLNLKPGSVEEIHFDTPAPPR